MKTFLAFLLALVLVGLAVLSLAHVRAAGPESPVASQSQRLPLAQVAQLIVSGGQDNDLLGYAVAASDDTVVAGAPGADGDQGVAYVFVKPGGGWSGVLTPAARLVASDGAALDRFGFAVALSGETIAVGAVGDENSRGAAYIFVRPGGGWSGTLTETAKLTAPDGGDNDSFAGAVSLDGDTLVAGAPFDTTGANPQQGSSYIFARPGSGWVTTSTFTAKLTASDGITDAAFGGSVSLSGDTLVVGAPGLSSQPDPDAAYIFVRPAGGWVTTDTFAARLTASDGEGTDVFGFSTALHNDTVVVGAPDDDNRQGSSYVFVKPGGGWSGTLTETAKLISSAGVAEDRLGLSLAIISNTVIAGAPGDDSGQGSAYAFARPAGDWVSSATFAARLRPPAGAVNDIFGFAMAPSGQTLVLGAPGSEGNRGSAYLFGPGRALYLPLILR